MDPRPETTHLLQRVKEGDAEAAEELMQRVYDELRGVASRRLSGRGAPQALNTTGLVHEAWVRMVSPLAAGVTDRAHFFAVAAQAMRRVLVDHARARQAQKRGGGRAGVPLDSVVAIYEDSSFDILALHDALELLGERDPVLAQVVELRYFGGLSDEEAGEVMGCSRRTVLRHWETARAWLYRRLSGESKG